MEYKDLIKITRTDDNSEAVVNITSEEDFKAAVVSLTAILHKKQELGLMVLVGLLARRQDPDFFDENEIIVPGGMPWD